MAEGQTHRIGKEQKMMHDPLNLGDGDDRRYLAIDVHGFDGAGGLVLESGPVRERGTPSEAPLRVEVVAGITPAEFSCFLWAAEECAYDNWHRYDQRWFTSIPPDGIPAVPPIRGLTISKVEIMPGMRPRWGGKEA